MRIPVYLLLIGSFTAAHAEPQLTWISQSDEKSASISYQAWGTDNLWFWIGCNVADGTGTLGFEWKLENIKDGQRINFTVSGPGGSNSYVGVAKVLELGDGTRVNVKLSSAMDASVPLSKSGTLTIRYPRNSFTIPLGPRAALALNTFRSKCPYADDRVTWYSFLSEGKVIISYGVPETDDVRFSIVCNVSDGTGMFHPGDIVGVKEGERVNFTVSGPGGTRSYTAVAQDEHDAPPFVSVDLPSSLDALAPLSKPGTLTIQFPKNSFTIPLGPKAAQALNAFRSKCPPAKQPPR